MLFNKIGNTLEPMHWRDILKFPDFCLLTK